MEQPVYHVGDLVEGGRVLAHDGATPQEGMTVWLETDPDKKMSFDEAEEALDVEWLMEPVPADGPVDEPAMPDDPDAEPEPPVEDEMPKQSAVEAVDPLGVPDAESDPMALLDEAEGRIGTIEGMVADIMLADVQDEQFLDEPEDEDPETDDSNDPEYVDMDVDEKAKRAAADPHQATAARLAIEHGSIVAGLAPALQLAAHFAAVAADEAAGDEVADDDKKQFADRLGALMERLGKLEETVAQLLDSQMEDSELVDADPEVDTVTEGEPDSDNPEE